MRLIYHPDAEAELIEAADFYEFKHHSRHPDYWRYRVAG